MRTLLAVLAAAVLLSFPTDAVAAGGCPPLSQNDRIQSALVLPPVASVLPTPVQAISLVALKPLCERKDSLICTGGAGHAATWEQVVAIDATLRAQFEYRSDDIQYGRDTWKADVVCGDCEDYALTLAERLHRQGVGGRFMQVMIWEWSTGMAHATLLVELEDGRVVEAGVGTSGVPAEYAPAAGRRFATIRLDGRRRVEPMPGYRVTATTVEYVGRRP